MRRKLGIKQSGFTLAEVLMVVAILIILMGISFVSVFSYLRNLKLTEYDQTAQELFLSAQYHLSVAKTNGTLDNMVLETNSSETEMVSALGYKEGTETSLYDLSNYYVEQAIKESKNSGKDATAEPEIRTIIYTPDEFNENTPGYAAYQMIMPSGSMDETIRQSGTYMITYDVTSAYILGVFYSGAADNLTDSRYKITFDKNLYDKEAESLRSAMGAYEDGKIDGDAKDVRKHFTSDKKVIGFYGGQDIMIRSGSKVTDRPLIAIDNGNKLRVVVTVNKQAAANIVGNQSDLRLTIKGKTSGKTVQIYYNGGSGKKRAVREGIPTKLRENTQYIIVLDNYVEGKGETFAEQFTDLLPGENIEVYATVVDKSDDETKVAKDSVTRVTNSLFESFNESTNTASISTIRHLENLSVNISKINTTVGENKITPEKAIQKADMDWDAFIADIGDKDLKFEPIRIDYSLEYDGNEKTIANLNILGINDSSRRSYSGGDSALFGTIGKLDSEYTTGNPGQIDFSIKNLSIQNIVSEAVDTGDAGAVIGSINLNEGNVSLEKILVYGDKAIIRTDTGNNKSGINAGGIIGSYMGMAVSNLHKDDYTFTINNCGVSALVNSATANVSKIPLYVGWNNGGGLIGTVLPRERNTSNDTNANAPDRNSSNLTVQIENSYVGGKMKDGKYLEILNPGRTDEQISENPGWNVSGRNTAGGLIGALFSRGTKFTTIKHCYSTASVWCGNTGTSGYSDSGGLIGFLEATNENLSTPAKDQPRRTLIDTCYAAGRVAKPTGTNTGNTGTLIGTLHTGKRINLSGGGRGLDTANEQDDVVVNCYYMVGQPKSDNNISIADKPYASSYSNSLNVVEGLDSTEMYDLAFDDHKEILAVPFDTTLGSVYPFQNWTKARANTTANVNTHYGDWYLADTYKPSASFVNEEVLQLKFTVPKASLEADGSMNARIKVTFFNLSDKTGTDYLMYESDDGYVPKELEKYCEVTEDNENVLITITLDDVTTADGRFGKIFKNWEPGTNIAATVTRNGINSLSVSTNSLFGDGTNSSTVAVNNGRHLQNLSEAVSGAYKNSSVPYTIRLNESIDWINFFKRVGELTGGESKSVYYDDGKAAPAGQFVSIVNKKLGGVFFGNSIETEAVDAETQLKTYAYSEGQSHEISNVVLMSSNGTTGLFGKLERPLSIYNLNLSSIKTDGKGSIAGALLGDGGNSNILVSNVYAYGKNTSISASNTAGGLIGVSKAVLTAKNSGVTAYVKGATAGGFIGNATDSVISGCYSGGRTTAGSYESDYELSEDGIYNIEGTANAGGFVGVSSNTKITESFSSSSAHSENGKVGGFVGTITGGSLEQTYAVGVVHGTKGSAGAYAGHSDHDIPATNYYLNGLNYFGNDNQVILMQAVGNRSDETATKPSAVDDDQLHTNQLRVNETVKTKAEDSTLNGQNYPFIMYRKDSTYYGDWKTEKTVNPWSYSVEIKVKYPGMSEPILYSTDEYVTNREQAAVKFRMPTEFKGFKLGDQDEIKYLTENSSIATFVVEPDTDQLELISSETTYDGSVHEAEHKSKYDGVSVPDNCGDLEYFIYYRPYGSTDEKEWTVDAPKNAGVYQIAAVGTVTVDGKKYSIIDQKTENLKLEIKKVELTFTSPDYQFTYDGTEQKFAEVKNHKTITVTGDMAENEGFDFVYTGSLTKPGTAENTFTYSAKEGTDKNNYSITEVNGILTMTWSYTVNYSFQSLNPSYVSDVIAAGEDVTKLQKVEDNYKDNKYLVIDMYSDTQEKSDADPVELAIPDGFHLTDSSIITTATYDNVVQNSNGYNILLDLDTAGTSLDPAGAVNAYVSKEGNYVNKADGSALKLTLKLAPETSDDPNVSTVAEMLPNLKHFLNKTDDATVSYDTTNSLETYQNTKSDEYRIVYRVKYTGIDSTADNYVVTYIVNEEGTVTTVVKVDNSEMVVDNTVPDSSIPNKKGTWKVTGEILVQKYGKVAKLDSNNQEVKDSDGNVVYETYSNGQEIEWTDYSVLWNSDYSKAVETRLDLEEAVNALTTSPDRIYLAPGATGVISSVTDPVDSTITWSSSDENIATVDANGHVTAKGVGTATVIASANSGSLTSSTVVRVVESEAKAANMTNAWRIKQSYENLRDNNKFDFSKAPDNAAVGIIVYNNTPNVGAGLVNDKSYQLIINGHAYNYEDPEYDNKKSAPKIVEMLGLSGGLQAQETSYMVVLTKNGNVGYYEGPWSDVGKAVDAASGDTW